MSEVSANGGDLKQDSTSEEKLIEHEKDEDEKNENNPLTAPEKNKEVKNIENNTVITPEKTEEVKNHENNAVITPEKKDEVKTCTSCIILKGKLDKAEQTVDKLQQFLEDDKNVISAIEKIFEQKLDEKLAEIKGTLGNVASGIGDIKGTVDIVDSTVAQIETKMEDLSVSEREGGTKLTRIEEELKQSLHRPGLQTIQSTVKDVGRNVKEVIQKNMEIELRLKDTVENTRKITEKMDCFGKAVSVEAETKEEEVFQLLYEELPNSDGIIFAGDRILDQIKLRMPDAIFDLFPQSKMITKRAVYSGEFVVMESYGPMLRELNESTHVLVLSFSSDDMLADPTLLTEKTCKWLDGEKREQKNVVVMEAVAQRVNEVLEKVSNDYPNVKIIFVLPPPSVREGDVFRLLRTAIKELPIMKKIDLVDINDVLRDFGSWESTVAEEAGLLTWEANRLVLKQVYIRIFPEMKDNFCGDCNGIHREYCPGPNSANVKHREPKLEKDQCFFCHQVGHKHKDCPLKKILRKRNIHCPHCGASPQSLPHQPDWCPFRYTKCTICDQIGHKTELHQNLVQLRKVYDRLKFNFIASEVFSDSKEPSLKKLKVDDDSNGLKK